ncbi:MAG TPA: NAD(P)H-hydrate dehydratase [Oscillospiraceae bacterium]|nr:NAD(P)H-hydrate dehydratase [Oscillospiraceae bacterium]
MDAQISITHDLVGKILPRRSCDSHKGDYGYLLNIAGSSEYIGAAALSTLAALRSGVGICCLCAPREVIASVSSSIYEAIYLQLEEEPSVLSVLASYLKRATAISLGMGIGLSNRAREIVSYVLKNANCPIILDADGINCIADNISIVSDIVDRSSLIITPHPGEMARLMKVTAEQVQANRVQAAKSLCEEMGAIVVLKGSNTVIAVPSGGIYVNTTGNAGLARGGAGDVLSGMIAALLAQGIPAPESAIAGVYLHGLAADMVAARTSMQGMLPSDVITELPMVFRLFE